MNARLIAIGTLVLLVGGYFFVAPPLRIASAQDEATATSAETKPDITINMNCPPDVYSQAYESYLSQSDDTLDIRLEPSLFGTVANMDALNKIASTIKVPTTGTALIFTAKPFDKLHVEQCAGRCEPQQYQSAFARCADAMSEQCIEFGIVLDGVAQCLMIPKPE